MGYVPPPPRPPGPPRTVVITGHLKRSIPPDPEPYIPTALEEWDDEFERACGYRPRGPKQIPRPIPPANINVR
jgi:hypothetical protein